MASLIVAAGLVVLYSFLLVAGPQLPSRAPGGHHPAHPPQRPTKPPSVRVRGCAAATPASRSDPAMTIGRRPQPCTMPGVLQGRHPVRTADGHLRGRTGYASGTRRPHAIANTPRPAQTPGDVASCRAGVGWASRRDAAIRRAPPLVRSRGGVPHRTRRVDRRAAPGHNLRGRSEIHPRHWRRVGVQAHGVFKSALRGGLRSDRVRRAGADSVLPQPPRESATGVPGPLTSRCSSEECRCDNYFSASVFSPSGVVPTACVHRHHLPTPRIVRHSYRRRPHKLEPAALQANPAAAQPGKGVRFRGSYKQTETGVPQSPTTVLITLEQRGNRYAPRTIHDGRLGPHRLDDRNRRGAGDRW